MISYLENLAKTSESKIIWVGPFLEYRRNPSSNLFKEELNTVNQTSIELFEELNHTLQEMTLDVKTFSYMNFHSIFYEPVESFSQTCFYFRDGDHYSKCGELSIGRKFYENFSEQSCKLCKEVLAQEAF